ncbi:pimelyl-ACP methyl ester esterase BioV [Sulfurospirillum sp. 1307]
MKYFNGFSLEGEEELFESFTCKDDFCVVGFSYGAQRALEYAFTCKERIDKLQLISPAFFQDRDKKFKKLQKIAFRKNSDEYCKNFLKSCGFCDDKYFKKGSIEELDELLEYEWSIEKLQSLIARGIQIEVFLGEKDKIINPLHVKRFFQKFATIWFIKDKGHIL